MNRPIEPGMNLAEHKLMITMLARQAALIKTLADILRSHGLMTDEDIMLFDSFLTKTAELYSELATKLGLDVPVKTF